MSEHSPIPWQTDPNDECLVLDANGKSAADVRIDVCDAAFIVRAVNCHERLLEACKALQSEAAARGCGLRIADESIAAAEGK